MAKIGTPSLSFPYKWRYLISNILLKIPAGTTRDEKRYFRRVGSGPESASILSTEHLCKGAAVQMIGTWTGCLAIRFAHSARRDAPAGLYDKIQEFLRGLDVTMLPKKDLRWAFSRSRGPGGQNVNKVNTKAELQVNPEDCSWIPPELHAHLPNLLIIKSDQHRTQPDNQRACLVALQRAIEEAAAKATPKPVSEEQRKRVHDLKRADNESRLRMKRMRAETKGSRSMSRSWKDD